MAATLAEVQNLPLRDLYESDDDGFLLYAQAVVEDVVQLKSEAARRNKPKS